MAGGNFTLLSPAALGLGEGKFNFGSDSYVVVLLNSSYTPNENTDATWANLSAYEIATGNGYTQGGVALGGVAWATSSGNTTLSAYSVQWTSSTLTAKYAAIVRKAGASLQSTDLVVGFADLNNAGGGATVSSVNGTFQVNWNSASPSTPSSAGVIFSFTHTP